MNNVRKLLFANGRFALIDEEDYELIYPYQWKINKLGYVFVLDKTVPISYRLHNLLLEPAEGCVVDHINGKPFDNRKSNLRVASPKENSRNTTIKSSNTSGYKGVSFFWPSNKWRATICVNYKSITIGYYATKEEAALAYNKAALTYHVNFARLNNI